MTALPPDPDPADTPSVEASVPPGETPPDSAQTSGSANADPPPRRARSGAVLTIIAIALLLALFVATGVLLVGRMFGLFG
jgi:hypothetical protein